MRVNCIRLFFFPCASQFRGSEVLELQNFKPASIDDIASVHSKAYVLGLEKVASHPTIISSFNSFNLSEARKDYLIEKNII